MYENFQAILYTDSMQHQGQKKQVRWDLPHLERPTPARVKSPSDVKSKDQGCCEPIPVPARQISKDQPSRRDLKTFSQPAYQPRLIEHRTRWENQEVHLTPEDRVSGRPKFTETKTKIQIHCSHLDTVVVRLTSCGLECVRPWTMAKLKAVGGGAVPFRIVCIEYF